MVPRAGEAGDAVVVTSQGFQSAEQVRITWSPWIGTDTSVLRDVVLDAEGAFKTEGDDS